MTESEARTDLRSLAGTILARVIIPLYVLFGAAMKFQNAAPEKLPTWIRRMVDRFVEYAPDYGAYMNVLKAIIVVEVIAAGLMLFVGRLSRVISASILLAFIAVLAAEVSHLLQLPRQTLWHVLFDSNCGCFGSALPMKIGTMLILDTALLIAVVVLPTRSVSLGQTSKWAYVTASLWAVAGLVGIPMVLAYQKHLWEQQNNQSREENYAFENPMLWKGKMFAETMLAQLVPFDPDTFNGGSQTWMLYSKTCPTCHYWIEKLFSATELDRTVVLIAVPLEGVTMYPPEEARCPGCAMIHDLPSDTEWIVQVPTFIEIEDDVIIDVWDPKLSGTNAEGE